VESKRVFGNFKTSHSGHTPIRNRQSAAGQRGVERDCGQCGGITHSSASVKFWYGVSSARNTDARTRSLLLLLLLAWLNRRLMMSRCLHDDNYRDGATSITLLRSSRPARAALLLHAPHAVAPGRCSGDVIAQVFGFLMNGTAAVNQDDVLLLC
jgi:hypothetical protein